MGLGGINLILSALDLPTFTSPTYKRYERFVGQFIENLAKECCKKNIELEKKATIAATGQQENPSEPLGLKAGIDAGWQKRGTGHNYNSLSGKL